MTSDPPPEMPDFLLADARRFYASGAAPVLARPAATVLLLRPPFEVYLLRRAASMAFAADMYAFPGGRIDPRDAGTDLDWVPPRNPPDLPDDQARAVVCAAVREVFEETGVLLAGRSPDSVLADVSGPSWERARAEVEDRSRGFAELLREQGLVLRGDLLAGWTRWITPEFEPRRYDTYFFVAELPTGQLTRHVSREASHTVWLPPAEAVGLPMLPPTRITLGELAGFDSPAAVLAAAVHRDASTAVRPELVWQPDGSARFDYRTLTDGA